MKKCALVTGAAKGIGFAIAKALAQEQIELVINDILPDQDVIHQLEQLQRFTRVVYCRADISQSKDRDKILQTIESQSGNLHFLINNAGIAPQQRMDILKATEKSFQHVLATNLHGPYFLTQVIANKMIEQVTTEFRCIINIGSSNATAASVQRGEYCISKAGLAMATQLWAVRLAEYHIPVYEIRPGIIKTDMTLPVKEKYEKLIQQNFLLQKRWGMPNEIGKTVAMLVNGTLSYSTGQIINIDGGRHLDWY